MTTRSHMKWTIGVFVLGLFLLFFSFYPTIYPYFIKPPGREYTFLEGFSEDYTGYVSYVKHAMSGKNYAVVRSAPNKSQTPTTIHLLYVLIGKIGRIFHLSAPIVYHLGRAVIGMSFVFIVFYFFFFLLKDKIKALFLTIISFVSLNVGWFTFTGGKFIYATLGNSPYSFDITKRVASRPHYELGAILFLAVFLLIFNPTIRLKLKGIFVPIFSLALALVHAPFALVLFLTELFVLLFAFCLRSIKISKDFFPFLWSLMGLFFGLLISYWASKQPPWDLVYVVRGEQTLKDIWYQIVFFGPTFWLGIPGLVVYIIKVGKKNLAASFLFLWAVIQLSFFFFFYRVINSDPTRFIQSLYFIPLAFGTSVLFKGKNFYVISFLLILLAIPTYIHDFQKGLVYREDKPESFSAFVFPSKDMMTAFEFLDRKTAYESTVLAGYEVANNIPMYSHNFTIGNFQGWTTEEAKKMDEEKNRLFMGLMSEGEMRSFLKKYKIEYVYGGYQEKLSDVYERRKDLFDPVYQNNEVVIYKVTLLKL